MRVGLVWRWRGYKVSIANVDGSVCGCNSVVCHENKTIQAIMQTRFNIIMGLWMCIGLVVFVYIDLYIYALHCTEIGRNDLISIWRSLALLYFYCSLHQIFNNLASWHDKIAALHHIAHIQQRDIHFVSLCMPKYQHYQICTQYRISALRSTASNILCTKCSLFFS